MKLVRLLFVPFAFLCVAIIRLLARFGVVIRFGELLSPRLGHLAGNTEVYFCEKKAGLSKGFDILVHNGPVANKQLAKMIARKALVDRTGFSRLVMLCDSTISGWQNHIAQPQQLDRDIHNLLEKYPPTLSFTQEEEEYGYRALKRLGLRHGDRWVYLIVRDDAKHPGLPYHSYRNAKIENYVLAAKFLADKGYYVFRMGKDVLAPFPVKHPRIIDFAQQHDDFMAVYLGAKCEFCISTGTGPDAIPYIFRRPICYTDFVPVEYLFTFLKGSLAIWKHHEKDGKRMTFKEIIDSGAGQFMRAEEFEKAGITLVDNTPEEIKAVVEEMAFRRSQSDQSEFWSQFPKSESPYNQKPLHGEIRMRIGAEFLKGYQ